MAQKIIIVGGVAGGATLATRLRRLNEADEIILLEQGEHISFANCGLPYHIGGVIKQRKDLLLQTPEGMSSQYNLDVRNFSKVTHIDPQSKVVTIQSQRTGKEYTESYDKLVLSTGAKPITPPIPGLNEADNVFALRNIPDMDDIKAYIKLNHVEVATIIGGGFIGLEMMENLAELGIKVQLVEMAPQVMPNIDFEMAQILHAQIEMHGVHLILNDGLKEFQNQGKNLVLNSGTELESDLTILSIGVTPENTLAKDINLELGFKNAIKVNNHFQTSEPDIYAIGDVIEVVDFINGKPTNIPLAWPANRQARLLGDILNDIPADYPGTMGTSAAKVFELTAAATGNSERILKMHEIEYETIHIHPNSHASYYPEAAPMALKLIYSPKDGTIYGAQGVGSDGVDKRIDVIATAIKFGAKADQLAGIELAYAPPYSSAKDPVNMLGYTADNLLHDRFKAVQWHQVDELINKGAFILDIREDFELATGKIKTDLWIPLSELRDRIEEVPTGKPIYVYCQVGQRGYNAARVLIQHGYEVYNIDGGYKTYKQATYQLKNKKIERQVKVANPVVSDAVKALASNKFIEVDACGLQCPGPILKVKENMDAMEQGQVLQVQATDFGFMADIEAWAKNTGNTLISSEIDGKKVVAKVMKGTEANPLPGLENTGLVAQEGLLQETRNGATMVVFSGDMDKAIASMIIASGAAAMGKQVTIFFTFWGLSILKQKTVKKTGLAKMFDIMLPTGADSLPLSSMNMGGMGRKMMKTIMKQKNVDSLPVMIERARDLGVKFVACSMSMDIMGIEKEELFDFVEIGGVAAYLGDAENANVNLFI